MHELTWGFPVALDLFFAGIAAGAFCFSVLAGRSDEPGLPRFAKRAALLAPLALGAGLLMLILDLRYKTRFWFTVTVFNYHSPMSVGVWLLSLFGVVSALHALLWLRSPAGHAVYLSRSLSSARAGARSAVGLLGLPLALGVSVYTAVLLSVTAVPLWRTLALPFLFAVSALATGAAAAAVAGAFSGGPGERALGLAVRSVRLILPVYLGAALLHVALLAATGDGVAVRPLLFTAYGLVWWTGAVGVGIVVPLFLVAGRRPLAPGKAFLAFSCVLVGGFLLRLVLVYAGQESIDPALLSFIDIIQGGLL